MSDIKETNENENTDFKLDEYLPLSDIKETNENENTDFKLDEYLPFQFFIISALMCQELGNIYGRFSIDNNKEWRVMAFLYNSGRLSMSKISSISFIDPVNLTRAVENLFQKGYCERFYDPSDRRKIEVKLSEEGIKTMTAMIRELKQWEKEFIGIIGKETSKDIKKNFGGIKKALAGDNKIKVN